MNTKLNELKAKVAEIQKEIEKLEKEEKEESKYLDLSANTGWVIGEKWQDCEIDKFSFAIRNNGKYNCKGFYLSNKFNWEIVTDDLYNMVLLPTKK